MTATLARLDYRTADAAQAAIANLITAPGRGEHQRRTASDNGHLGASPLMPVTAMPSSPRLPTRIVADGHARWRSPQPGRSGRQLRRQGYTVANSRLRWLSSSAASSLRRRPSRTGNCREPSDGTT